MVQRLQTEIETRYGLSLVGWHPLTGGDECRVWRARRMDRGGDVVVRVSPAWRTLEEIGWTHAVVRFAAAGVPEAITPLLASDGTTCFAGEGGVVALFPFVPGRAADRSRHEERVAAAELLGHLHRRLRQWPARGESLARPQSRQPHPTAPRDPVPGEPPALADGALNAWHAERTAAADLVVGAVHGDYYRRNLRWAGGRITGVIDWDEAHVGFLMQEAAWTAWEFAKSPAGDDLNLSAARAFLDAYRTSGGPCPRHEDRHALAFIRWRLRGEIRGNLQAAARGQPWDPDYVATELRAFERLSSATLPE